ncbi:hypothetical protein TTRE_0000787901 [Trichuris trichiura]|uniref:Uncharacterized protein n=1 Tax=Trichuris trichiura TaxID=36087 RepID=A0A077ZGR4_TRITR|nr:hypothetical protein TTRE_0000787901 [Trichuris trichiura]
MSDQAVEIDGIPRHVRDVRRRAPPPDRQNGTHSTEDEIEEPLLIRVPMRDSNVDAEPPKTARDRNVAAEHEKASATGGKKGQRKRVPSIDEDPSSLSVRECARVLRDELEKVKEENLEVQLTIDQIPKLKGLNDNGGGILAKLLDDPASLSITEELKEFIDIAENAEDNSRMENQKRRKRQRRLPDGPSTSKE